MNLTETGIKDLIVLEPRVFNDARGFFFESYNKKALDEKSLSYDFIQDNQSKSSFGVIRGLHFQLPPYAQTKLVRVLVGEIFDVAVDIRRSSPTFGQWFGIRLSAENKKQLLIPKGFAHGFSVLSDVAEVMYKCDNYYAPGYEGGLCFNDPKLAIDWQIDTSKAIVAEKDLALPLFDSTTSPF